MKGFILVLILLLKYSVLYTQVFCNVITFFKHYKMKQFRSEYVTKEKFSSNRISGRICPFKKKIHKIESTHFNNIS